MLSELPSLTLKVIVVLWSPSSSSSSTAVTVTVWALFQFKLVKVKDALSTIASPVSAEEMLITTSDEGWAVKTTVNVSVVVLSSSTEVVPPVCTTVNPHGSAVAAVTV